MKESVKRIFDGIYANGPQKEYFAGEAEKKTLSHAYIIEGAAGSGKYMMACAVCALIADDDRAAEMISAGLATDVMTVEAEESKKQIGIAAVRAMRSDAYIKPNDFEFKAYIIRGADRMTVQAQNAILKLLEEPPQGVYFFLLAENASALLATVRSRAPVIRMQMLTPEETEEYLLSHSSKATALNKRDPEAFEQLLRSRGQTIGGALEALDSEGSAGEDVSAEAIALIESLCGRRKAELFLAINGMPQKREDLLPYISSAMNAVRDMICVKSMRQGADLRFGYYDRLFPCSRNLSMSQLVGAYTALERANEDLAANLNVQNTKAVLSSELWKCVG